MYPKRRHRGVNKHSHRLVPARGSPCGWSLKATKRWHVVALRDIPGRTLEREPRGDLGDMLLEGRNPMSRPPGSSGLKSIMRLESEAGSAAFRVPHWLTPTASMLCNPRGLVAGLVAEGKNREAPGYDQVFT